jgi:signal transduction histidine kinase/CheY-like chemotaxis protein
MANDSVALKRRLFTWLLVCLIFAIAFTAALAINRLQERAQLWRQTEIAMARLQAKANALSVFEWWEALNHENIAGKRRAALSKSRVGMQEQLTLIKSMTGQLPQLDRVLRKFDAYIASIEKILDILEAGNTEEARKFDGQVVDPAYDDLNEALERADQEVNSLALMTLARLHELTYGVWLAAAALVALLFWQYHTKQRAAQITLTEKRILREANEELDKRVQTRTAELAQANAALNLENQERKHAETLMQAAKLEADKANHAKSDFLSRMSHEFRTPLNAIIGFGQLLERQNPTEAQRNRIRHVLSAGRHLLNLINEVLDISRIEAGNLQLSLEPVAVASMLEETVELIQPMAAERSLEVSITPSTTAKNTYIFADRQRLKQVLLNLLSNAVKYTPQGAITISHVLHGKDGLRIFVVDTGPGIPPQKLERVFNAFDRLGAEQTQIEGTGLGLALSQRLIQAMKGSIGVSSVVGKGSTFWIELPVAKSPLESMAQRTRPAAEKPKTRPSRERTLLYIEDNLSNLTLIEQVLEGEPDIKLLTAMQGQLGLDLARKHHPDLILLDLHLPDLPGQKVLDQLQCDESTRKIPVVVLSADATPGQIERLKQAGAREYLTKPLDVTEFFEVVEEITIPKGMDEPALV